MLVTILACVLAVGSVSAAEESSLEAVDSTTTQIAVPPAPATSVLASDHKYDNGQNIDLAWVPSIDDRLVKGTVTGYELWRSTNGGEFVKIADLVPGTSEFTDGSAVSGDRYVYKLVAVAGEGRAESIPTEELTAEWELLDWDRAPLFFIALIIAAAVVYFVETARRGKKLFIRKIAGLEAIDDAVGRATEMGRPVLYVPGINDMDDVQTLASLTILGRVSRTIADYDTRIFMPVSRSLVMTAARETIKGSYMAAGRPDAYSDDIVSYVTDEQFGYVGAVDGIMVRERPATVFLLGAFFAESLILAETGNYVGAIQIAGTARPAQLPFFIAACDFTLIGEELFAASAYLSGEPKQLGSLKGQDLAKAIAMVVILVGVIASTFAFASPAMDHVYTFLQDIFSSN